jgi:spectinomycin phosphotransferase
MLEKPDISDTLLLSAVENAYGLRAAQITFLPLGADWNTAVYRLAAADGTSYFLKLRKSSFAAIVVDVPHFLYAHGNSAIIPPLETNTGQYWTSLGENTLILYPFIEGQDGYRQALSERQWNDFGAALKRIHDTQLPPSLSRFIPQEDFSPRWRRIVTGFQEQVESQPYDEPVAAKAAALMKANRAVVSHLVNRCEELASRLQAQPLDLVLCHSDMHAGNLLINPSGRLYIVDWDNPMFAPKERDLILIGGGGGDLWTSPRSEQLFYQGYGRTRLDPAALSYFRYERIIEDIAAYCEQILSYPGGGDDRENSYRYFSSQFLPNHEIDIACRTDRSTPSR